MQSEILQCFCTYIPIPRNGKTHYSWVHRYMSSWRSSNFCVECFIRVLRNNGLSMIWVFTGHPVHRHSVVAFFCQYPATNAPLKCQRVRHNAAPRCTKNNSFLATLQGFIASALCSAVSMQPINLHDRGWSDETRYHVRSKITLQIKLY